ncbi:MAG: heme-degrading domain-containing protein [Gulosibacter sp.]|uniref:heme-degrading domain-containing protein n=1 Tax=Gulosibacter sp. TaxID=2817531 RepID=UPI003F931FE3
MFEVAKRYLGMTPTEAHNFLLEEEYALTFDRFGLDEAWKIGTWLHDYASDHNLSIAIAITLGSQRAFHAATGEANEENDAWLERKFRIVRRYGHSSLAVRYEFLANGQAADEHTDADTEGYAAAGGGFPIRVGMSVVGMIGVSGLEMHEDHALIVKALQELLVRA